MKKRGWQGFIVTQPGRRRRDGRESVSWRVECVIRCVCVACVPPTLSLSRAATRAHARSSSIMEGFNTIISSDHHSIQAETLRGKPRNLYRGRSSSSSTRRRQIR